MIRVINDKIMIEGPIPACEKIFKNYQNCELISSKEYEKAGELIDYSLNLNDYVFMDIQNNHSIQVTYEMEDHDNTIEREFGAYKSIEDNYPKYVISLDKIDLTRDGIIHLNLIDFLLSEEF